MSSQIPLDANFQNLSCQLGGLRLNGKVNYSDPTINGGTAKNYNVLNIDDTDVIINELLLINNNNFLSVSIGKKEYFIPLYERP